MRCFSLASCCCSGAWGMGPATVRPLTPSHPPSLPGLTRQSIVFAKCFLRRRWTRGSSPRVTVVPGCSPASLAEPRERVGGDAPLRALDPGLGGRARVGRKLRQFGDRTGNVAPRNLGLGARDDRGGIAARGLIDAADADELLGIQL